MGDDAATVELAIRAYRDADFEPVRALWDACRLIVPHNDPANDIAFCRATAVNGGVKRDHRGGVKRDRLAAASLSP